MQFPFVSRERFVESQDRIRRLEEENRRLTEILIPAMRAPSESPLRIAEDSDLSKIQPIPGKPTIASIQAEANLAALKNSEIPGAKSIAESVQEKVITPWRRPVGK